MNILSKRFYSALSNPATKVIKKSVTFHPSSASIVVPAQEGGNKVIGSCLRESYYRMTEIMTSNTTVPDYIVSANIGDKLHDYLNEVINDHGFIMGLQKIDSEHSFLDEDLNLSGRSDLIVWDHFNNEMVGIEIKSVGEFKSGKVIERPDPVHVMQCMLYLDHYRTTIPELMHRPTKWYIWYISRSEGWSTKGKKHLSPLQMLWDFYITLDDNGIPSIHTSSGNERWEHFSVEKIKDRYRQLRNNLDNGILPDRDFQIEYSEEKIVGLYKTDQLTRKTDKEKVEKWLAKGAKEGKLGISMGDFECSFCAWKDHCWYNTPLTSQNKFNLPTKSIIQEEATTYESPVL